MNYVLKSALLSSVFATGFVSFANVVNAAESINLDTVTVVATRTAQKIQDVPAQVSVIEADSAQNGTTGKVSDLFKQVPGVEFSGGPRRNGEEIKMRGYDSEGIIIMVDGKKQNFNSAHDGRFFLDPALVKKVDVVKGPSSAAYGSGGLGGVIAFQTKDAADFLEDGDTEGFETSIGYQTANEEFFTGITGYKRGDSFDAVASVNFRDSEEIDLGNNRSIFSDDDILSGLAKFTYFADDYNTFKFDYVNFSGNSIEFNNPQANGSSSTGTNPTTDSINLVDKDNTVHQIGLKHNFDGESDAINLTTNVYYISQNVEETYIESSSLNNVGDVLDRQLETFGFNLDNISKLDGYYNNHTLSYGFELLYDKQEGSDSSRSFRNGVPNANSQKYGFYIQDEIKVAQPFGLDEGELYIIPGVRYDYFKNDSGDSTVADQNGENFSPKIAANLKLNDNYNIFASWAEAFRSPNLTEIYAQGTHFPLFGTYTNSFVPNPNLQPEKAKTFEIGGGLNFDSVAQSDDSVGFKASHYWTSADNYIEQNITAPNFGNPFTCPFPFVAGTCSGGTTQFTNVREASIKGFELEFTYLSSLFNATLTGARVNGTNELTGQYLESLSPFVFTADFNMPIESLDLTAGYFVKVGAPYDNVATLTDQGGFSNKRNDYVVHNLYYRYEPKEMPHLTLDFGIDNVLDKTYTETFASNYEVGRNFKVRLTYKW